MANKNSKKKAQVKKQNPSVFQPKKEVVVSDTKNLEQKTDASVTKKTVASDKKDLKTATNKKTEKVKKVKEKKPSKVVKKTKETFSELKKVTWPSFSTVVKQTGIVLAVVVFFTVVLFGFDSLLGWIYNIFTKNI